MGSACGVGRGNSKREGLHQRNGYLCWLCDRDGRRFHLARRTGGRSGHIHARCRGPPGPQQLLVYMCRSCAAAAREAAHEGKKRGAPRPRQPQTPRPVPQGETPGTGNAPSAATPPPVPTATTTHAVPHGRAVPVGRPRSPTEHGKLRTPLPLPTDHPLATHPDHQKELQPSNQTQRQT